MNRSASACSRDSARSIVWTVSGDAVSPSAVFRAGSGSAAPRIRWPMAQAISSRAFMPSGEAQESLTSEKPFGPDGCHNGIPMRPSAGR